MAAERLVRVTSSDVQTGWEVPESDYELLDEQLGRGKFGEVRLGEWWGTTVAVKFLYNFDLEENKDLFLKEIKVMKELHHPHIVQFMGFSKSSSLGDAPVILMEYCPHGSVEDYLLKHGARVSLAVRARWASQMAQALAYLHNRKPDYLIHRDLKPSNFMLTPSLQCKIGDFGISRLFAVADQPGSPMSPPPPPPASPPKVTAAASPSQSLRRRFSAAKSPERERDLNGSFELEQTSNVGTARYMAPEVYNNGDGANAKYGVKADIFSVGMVFFFVFEGEAPRVPGGGKPEMHFKALASGARPHYFKTKVEFQRIVDLCLKERATERPTAVELVKLLKPHTIKPAGGLAGLCTPGATEQRKRWQQADLRAKVTLRQVESREGTMGSMDLGPSALMDPRLKQLRAAHQQASANAYANAFKEPPSLSLGESKLDLSIQSARK